MKNSALFALQEKEMNRMNFGLLKRRDAQANKKFRPPRDEGMEGRLAKLEKIMVNSCDRLTRIETRLEQTATKTDLHREINTVTTNLHREMNVLIWRLVTFVCGFGTTLVVATYFVATHVR
jgi:hypothetical protein